MLYKTQVPNATVVDLRETERNTTNGSQMGGSRVKEIFFFHFLSFTFFFILSYGFLLLVLHATVLLPSLRTKIGPFEQETRIILYHPSSDLLREKVILLLLLAQVVPISTHILLIRD
jgi:hypothetical protein